MCVVDVPGLVSLKMSHSEMLHCVSVSVEQRDDGGVWHSSFKWGSYKGEPSILMYRTRCASITVWHLLLNCICAYCHIGVNSVTWVYWHSAKSHDALPNPTHCTGLSVPLHLFTTNNLGFLNLTLTNKVKHKAHSAPNETWPLHLTRLWGSSAWGHTSHSTVSPCDLFVSGPGF